MSPKKKLIAIRASDMTLKQLDELGQVLVMSQTEILTLAIDRLYQAEISGRPDLSGEPQESEAQS